MGKNATIDAYFKRKNFEFLTSSTPNVELSNIKTPPSKSPRIENEEVVKEVDLALLERDPALRLPIWKYPINQKDEIRRAYLKLGPYQCKLQNYPLSGPERNQRRFCSSWFDLFPSWLEYSPTKDAAFCLPCYLFSKPIGNGRFGLSTFVVEGFKNWKKVNDGENCAFLRHVGKNVISVHKNAVESCSDLMNQSQHIETLVERLTSEQIAANRLRLQVSVDVTRWLAFQGCAFRGHDENLDSLNRGNFLEMIKFLASYNQEVSRMALHRAGATRWSSHYNSISSLFKMFKAVCEVLDNISNEGKTTSQRGDAENAYLSLTSFDFVIILHLMKEIMGITEVLCQALQRESQDISNALHLVSTTKELLQNLRQTGWDVFLVQVREFCIKQNIDIPDMTAKYIRRRGRARNEQGDFSTEKFYRVNIFCATLDYQLQELNSRFNDNTVELLALSMSLDPRNGYKSFNNDDICKLVDKFYSSDFTEQEKLHLKMELQHFELDIPKHLDLNNLSTTSELCQGLARTGKSIIYPLIDRVIRLVLTLPVSTATTERAFSVMKIIKSRLRNRMEDQFLDDSLITYIEKEIVLNFSTDSIIEEFNNMKKRRARVK